MKLFMAWYNDGEDFVIIIANNRDEAKGILGDEGLETGGVTLLADPTRGNPRVVYSSN